MQGEDLVKLTYLDVWRDGTFLLYSCKVDFWIQETSTRLSDVERSVVLQSVLAISSAIACCFSRNMPLLHTSRYVIARDSVYKALPALVLQATNTGIRRPGIWQYAQECNCLRLFHMWWYNECTFASAVYILEQDRDYCRWVGEASGAVQSVPWDNWVLMLAEITTNAERALLCLH